MSKRWRVRSDGIIRNAELDWGVVEASSAEEAIDMAREYNDYEIVNTTLEEAFDYTAEEDTTVIGSARLEELLDIEFKYNGLNK